VDQLPKQGESRRARLGQAAAAASAGRGQRVAGERASRATHRARFRLNRLCAVAMLSAFDAVATRMDAWWHDALYYEL
jgi:glycosyltransferase A (GT-A) superfamily protein (DUF2064 family)